MPRDVPLIKTIEELTEEWLADALGREVPGFTAERIGTGQMSLSYRVTLGPGDSVVVKLAATDPTSRGSGLGLGIYEREVRFYRELAPVLRTQALAACHAAAIDSAGEWFTLVLDDVAPAVALVAATASGAAAYLVVLRVIRPRLLPQIVRQTASTVRGAP